MPAGEGFSWPILTLNDGGDGGVAAPRSHAFNRQDDHLRRRVRIEWLDRAREVEIRVIALAAQCTAEVNWDLFGRGIMYKHYVVALICWRFIRIYSWKKVFSEECRYFYCRLITKFASLPLCNIFSVIQKFNHPVLRNAHYFWPYYIQWIQFILRQQLYSVPLFHRLRQNSNAKINYQGTANEDKRRTKKFV